MEHRTRLDDKIEIIFGLAMVIFMATILVIFSI